MTISFKSRYFLLVSLFLLFLKIVNSQNLELLSSKIDSTQKYSVSQIINFAKQLEKEAKSENSEKYLLKAYSALAKNYYQEKRFNKSIRYFDKELEILERTSNDSKLAESYYNLASTCLKLNKNRKALNYFEISLEKAKQAGDIDLIRANNNALFVANESLSNHEESINYLKELLKTNEGSYNEEINLYKKKVEAQQNLHRQTLKILDTTQATLQQTEETVEILEEDTLKKYLKINSLNFQKALRELEIENKNDEIKAEKRFVFLLIIGISSVSVLAIFVFFLLQNRKKTHQRLIVQNEKIEKQNTSITNSIQYANRIQQAVLPDDKIFEQNFKEHFVLFKPRDIVSGDFYYIQRVNQYVVFAAADCTGHGVPGAFMSMLGIAFLNDIVRKKEVVRSSQILDLLRDEIKISLQQKGISGEQKDGMDMAICIIDTNTNQLQFAGAHNPLILIRSGKIIEYKGDRMPVGIHRKEKPFTNHEIQLQKDDQIYIYSDGFQDQVGGEAKKKYKSKNYKDLLLRTSNIEMSKQKELLQTEFQQWKADFEQIDDIVIIGVKI
jgi:serine phosphatase RsbU (regulator of sigma subunit)